MIKRLGTLVAASTLILLPAMVGFTGSAIASGGTYSPSVNVSGSVADDCSAPTQTDGPGINFAQFDPLSPATTKATGAFSILCSNNTVVQVYLNPSSGDRTMTGKANSSNTLSYQIYESDYSTPWPTTSGTAVTVGTSQGKSKAVTWTLYGELDNTANADAAVDSYTGSFTMNVVY